MIKKCPICGNKNFKFTKVLSVDLINDWKLNAEEVEYIKGTSKNRVKLQIIL